MGHNPPDQRSLCAKMAGLLDASMRVDGDLGVFYGLAVDWRVVAWVLGVSWRAWREALGSSAGELDELSMTQMNQVNG